MLNNKIGTEGAKAVADALRVNGVVATLDLSFNNISPEGAIAIAEALKVNGGLTALDLSSNDLKDEGVSAVCKAIQSNKETKLASLNVKKNGIGSIGANAVAAMVAVTGVLTVTNLLGNQLDAESAKMLAEVTKQKGISLCGIQRDQTTAYFSRQGLKPTDAILLASDLSQAGVTGSLTKMSLADNELGEEGTKAICEALEQNKTLKELGLSGGYPSYNNIGGAAGAMHVANMLGVNGGLTTINLSSNQLCGVWTDHDGVQQGTYTAEGITAIADALRVNGGLTSLNLSNSQLCGVTDLGSGTYTTEGITAIAEALRVNGGLTKMRYVSPQT